MNFYIKKLLIILSIFWNMQIVLIAVENTEKHKLFEHNPELRRMLERQIADMDLPIQERLALPTQERSAMVLEQPSQQSAPVADIVTHTMTASKQRYCTLQRYMIIVDALINKIKLLTPDQFRSMLDEIRIAGNARTYTMLFVLTHAICVTPSSWQIEQMTQVHIEVLAFANKSSLLRKLIREESHCTQDVMFAGIQQAAKTNPDQYVWCYLQLHEGE